MGLMHVEPIQVQAEAYDVAMDVSFPRGESTIPRPGRGGGGGGEVER